MDIKDQAPQSTAGTPNGNCVDAIVSQTGLAVWFSARNDLLAHELAAQKA